MFKRHVARVDADYRNATHPRGLWLVPRPNTMCPPIDHGTVTLAPLFDIPLHCLSLHCVLSRTVRLTLFSQTSSCYVRHVCVCIFKRCSLPSFLVYFTQIANISTIKFTPTSCYSACRCIMLLYVLFLMCLYIQISISNVMSVYTQAMSFC